MSKQTTLEKQKARIEAGREIAAALKLSAKKTYGFDRFEVQALSERIGACNETTNQFWSPDAFNRDTGEVYEATGSLWQCGSKLCPNCLANQARRSRKKLREAVANQTLEKGERYYFATFTIPNPKTSLIETRSIVDRAWQLFRKRSLCVELIRGGVKSEEFTLTPNGFHYHLHFIWLSKFLLYNEARRVWTECVEIAFAEANKTFQPMLKSNQVWVKILPITLTEKSIHEVCKYITKSDSWTKMRPQDLNDVALIKRWFRMFEMFGCFAKRNTSEVSVHTSNLSDGEAVAKAEYWRSRLEKIGLDRYRDELFSEISEVRRIRMDQLRRRWPESTIENLSK